MIKDSDKWRVTLITWNDFSKIMVEGPQNALWLFLWDDLDIILGGLNFEGDFLYVLNVLLPTSVSEFSSEIPSSTTV